GEQDHRRVKHSDIVEASTPGAFTLVVDDSSFGEVVILVARRDDAERQIYVFGIHEEGFVHEADTVENFPPDEHERSGKHLHLVDLILIQVTQVISAKNL